MPVREKIKSLFHRHDDESTPPSSPGRQTRADNGVSAQNGERPISGTDQSSQPSPARSRSKLRRSLDRKSAAPTASDSTTTRRSLDTKRKSLDQRQINAGEAPSVPAVPDTYKGETVARPISQDDAAKDKARRSSNVIGSNHKNTATRPLSEKSDKFSENTTDRNIMNGSSDAPAPLNVTKSTLSKSRQSSASSYSTAPGIGQTAVSRKAVGGVESSRDLDGRRGSVSNTEQRSRLSMDKPLPSPPKQTALSEDPAFGQFLPKDQNYLVKDAPATPQLEGIVDLRNTVDTDVTEHWAPAVVHETVMPQIHHIREEVVTREIHNHDIYHRILPIIDIEVLPARHFVPTGNGDELMEISADEIPGRTGYNQQWFVAEMLSKLPKDSNFGREPLRFTAREFPGTEGDYKEYVRNGIPTTERTWIHAPTLDDTMYLAGQTEPFHFGSANPADDGLRIRAPNGRVVGSSRYHKVQLERRVEAIEPPTESMRDLSMGDYLQAAPSGEATSSEALTPHAKVVDMARKARQRISYVLPLTNSAGGHRLGVNGLAVDSDNSILYSGGRDGVICAWDLNFEVKHKSDQITAVDAKPPPSPASTLHNQVQAHTHWINDLVLAQSNQALVSASSDISVKVWRPAATDPMPPQTIGLHSDYVKVLASPSPDASWVASAGLDRHIRLWDLNGAGETLRVDVSEDESLAGLSQEKASVYALKATHSILASGGPDSNVRIWDPRSGKRITKFVGHTDIVRDILISQDGCTVMSACSDQTVKVWSVTAGRCMNTLTMHDASVWSLWSDHPDLSVFYSSDKSGMVAKTDTRGCGEELEEGLSVAICQEGTAVHKLAVAGDYIWTATPRPTINRWADVNTDGAEIDLPDIYKQKRFSLATSRSRIPSPPVNSSSDRLASPPQPTSPTSPPPSAKRSIPLKHVLRLGNAAYFPRPVARETTPDGEVAEAEHTQPLRHTPDFAIEGQNGLVKHIMLNDRKRVLTQDTAGEVLLWDLLKCVPIKSFGRKHLEDVQPEVTTVETVPNWCSVDTRTGTLAITLEEHTAFDAEMYADELDIDQNIDFKEDQRINLGKWVLRYLFANLISEESSRDSQYRRHLLEQAQKQKLERENAPTSIQMPAGMADGWKLDPSAPLSTNTLRPTNTNTIGFATPGLSIADTASSYLDSPNLTRDGLTNEDDERTQDRSSISGDYFSNTSTTVNSTNANSETKLAPQTPGEAATTPAAEDTSTAETTDTPSKFGKRLRMNMSFNMKKLGKAPTNDKDKPAIVEETKEEAEADAQSSSDNSNSRVVDENFLGCIQKIRFAYEDHIQAQIQRAAAVDAAGGALGQSKELELPTSVVPSLPSETPVLKPPPNTTIIIQEERPEAGGVADLFEGKVGSTGEMADLIEKVAPMWLGDALLRNQIPLKDLVKISFVLEPWQNVLPSIAADGNNRLNANRMLRARKILGYVAERIEPAQDPATAMPPEDYLELYCNGQLIPPKMTLATIRTHIWRGGGDVLLHYKANGKRKILHSAENFDTNAGDADAQTESTDSAVPQV
ncbi:WD40 repeat-like protein [Aureobasidium subglaciale]|nr:WD40 repeat-like protein [Aureobasidium subglaciale]